MLYSLSVYKVTKNSCYLPFVLLSSFSFFLAFQPIFTLFCRQRLRVDTLGYFVILLSKVKYGSVSSVQHFVFFFVPQYSDQFVFIGFTFQGDKFYASFCSNTIGSSSSAKNKSCRRAHVGSKTSYCNNHFFAFKLTNLRGNLNNSSVSSRLIVSMDCSFRRGAKPAFLPPRQYLFVQSDRNVQF